MAERQPRRAYLRYTGVLFFVLLGLGLMGSAASVSGSRAFAATRAASPETCPGAYHYLLPQSGSPPSGGTIHVGDRFTLDLMLSPASYTIVAQDTYLTFTNALLQNVRATSPGCVLTNTITGDYTVLDSPLQDEVCNGPGPCVFRGLVRQPGSIAYSSGASSSPYSGPDFREAQVAFCATAPGQAVIHWQFSPPAPINLDTVIVDVNANVVSVRSCYEDYIVNIVLPASTPTDTPTVTNTPTPGTPTSTPTPATCEGANHYFLPQPGSPPNGGTANVGDRITLDMMVHSGSYTVNAQQAYLVFSSGLLQNVRADQPGCVLTNTVTKDQTIFDAPLQNEICNGPGQCNIRGLLVDPGSMAYMSAIGINPSYNGPDFRVAQAAFCVIAPGVATIHWQFWPPDPHNRDTEILNSDGVLVQTRACYVDYVINIPGATYTPTTTPTNTPGDTPPSTPTPTYTFTPTDTPTITPTVTPGSPFVLVGHITWQQIPQNNPRSRLPVTLTLKMGTFEVDYPVHDTDATGFFTNSVAGLPGGTYAWRVRSPKFLAASGTVTLAGNPQTDMENGTLSGGDANSSNIVNVFDFNMLKNSFGQAGIVPGDFNNDQVANVTDFGILKGNFGFAGSPAP